MTPRRWRQRLFALGAGLIAGAAQADDALWARLQQGGFTLFVRHASTVPGTGDPPGFRLDRCETQRNLSAAGRDEARALGEAFRFHRVPVAQVLSSRWCRCRDTAALAFGRAEPWPMLDSLYDDSPSSADQKTRAVKALAARPIAGNRVLVTHNFNVQAATGVSPAPGEIVVTETDGAGGLRVAGRISIGR